MTTERKKSLVGLPGYGETGYGSELEDERRPRRSLKRILGGLTIVTLVGGGGAAAKALHHNAKEPTIKDLRPPAITAPLTPGPETTRIAEPSPVETTPNGEWDLSNFPYPIDGKTYIGTAELEEKFGINVEKYPKGEEEARALFNNINIWINSLESTDVSNEITSYTSKSGQRVGLSAVAEDFAGPEWAKVLFVDPNDPDAISLEDAITTLKNLHYENIANAAQTTNDIHPYYAGFKINNVNVLTEYQDTVAVTLTGFYEDNGDQNSIGKKRSREGGYNGITTPKRKESVIINLTMKKVTGENGEKYSKVLELTIRNS